MEAQVYSNLRVAELAIGGTFIIPVEGLSDESKEETKPLGLTLWANRVEVDRW